MLRWVPAVYIQGSHLDMIAQSLHAAPEAIRLTPREVVHALNMGEMRLFEFENNNGLVMISAANGRLKIEAICCKRWQPKARLVAALKQLAADFECHTIATSVFDQRWADVIVGLGGKVEAIDLTLNVEREDGRKD